jgi:hypothetical protein
MVRRLSWIFVLLLGACHAERPDPEEVLRTFLSDLRNGRADAAWAALSESSQKELNTRHEELVKAGAVKTDATPAQLLFEDLGLMMVNPPESIAVASPHGQEVMLRVAIKDGKSADVRMVREGDRWKVDLTGSLKPAPPLEEKLEGMKEVETSTD